MPQLQLICPPVEGGQTCIIREDGHRQEWTRVVLDAHQLDYHNPSESLWPGWACWHHHNGQVDRYVSDHTLRVLNWLMCPPGPQPTT